MIDPSFVPKINLSLQNGQPFIIINENSVAVYAKDNFLNQKFPTLEQLEIEKQNFINNAKWLTTILRRTSRDFSKHQELAKATKLFLRTFKTYESNPSFQQCKLEMLALKLGIDSYILEKDINKGFKEFATNFYLYNSLMTFNHHLKIDSKTDEILILHRGSYSPWSDVKIYLYHFLQSDKYENTNKDPYALNLYGQKGIQYKNRYKWKKLKPFLKDDPSLFASHFIKDPQIISKLPIYILEFCTTTVKDPRLVGDHTFLRMYKFSYVEAENGVQPTLDGEITSVGVYRPGKRSFLDHIIFPFHLKPAKIARKDISDVYGINDDIEKFPVEISENAYQRIIAKIEHDNKNKLPYHLFEQNCDTYVAKDLASLAGINLPTKRHFLEIFTCIRLKHEWEKKISNYPLPFRLTAQVITNFVQSLILSLTPFFNLIFYMLGSGLVSKSLPKQTKPNLSSVFDFFNSEKLYTSSPWVLGNIIKEDVESWRAKKIAKLACTPDMLEKQRKIAFALPKRYRIQPK
jgi:hypothetical protein